MTSRRETQQSLPEFLLCQTGNSVTFRELQDVLKNVSDTDLEALEDDIEFYMATGLVGVQMSRLLPCLSVDELEGSSGPEASGLAADNVAYLNWTMDGHVRKLEYAA